MVFYLNYTLESLWELKISTSAQDSPPRKLNQYFWECDPRVYTHICVCVHVWVCMSIPS